MTASRNKYETIEQIIVPQKYRKTIMATGLDLPHARRDQNQEENSSKKLTKNMSAPAMSIKWKFLKKTV